MKLQIHQAISDALKTLGIDEAQFVVDYPTDTNTSADYFSNVAMVLSKQLGEAPRTIAERLSVALESALTSVEKIEVAGPGFLNFYVSRDVYQSNLAAIIAVGAEWGKNDVEDGEVVLLEYTSPNLFKPLHIGNLVGNIVGESLSRLFEYSGAEVKRCNYPSDIGLTVAKAVWGLQQTGGNPEDILALGEAYRLGSEAYDNDEQAKVAIGEVNQALYAESDAALSTLRARGIATSKQQLDLICERLGTLFDLEIFESEASPLGVDIVKQLTGDVFEESDGAVIYRGEKVNLHTRVFLNSKGLPTYEAKDLGNFAKKQAAFPDWTTSVVVTGNEQTEYFKVVYAAIREVFSVSPERTLEHIPTGFLTLTTGKMSSRKGNVLTGESLLTEMVEAARERAAESRTDNLDELTEQVAIAALKYQILRQAVGSNIVFDKEKALSFEGDSGPYLQYTHARICSVLEKVATAGIVQSTAIAPAAPYEIEKVVCRFPEVIKAALAERAPHKVAGYLIEVASAFNTFYAHEKIADSSDEYAAYKAAITETVRLTLKHGLWVLGIKAPERM